MKLERVRRAVSGLAGVVIAAALVACATTRLEAQWSNPHFAATRITGKVLLVGVTRDDTVRRLYEDEMAAQLTARGVAAVRSYEVLAAALGSASSDLLTQAARRACPGAILSSAVVGREHVQRVITEPMPTWAWGYAGWYGHYWSLAMTRTEVQTYERFVVGTSLTDVASGKIVWTARTATDSTDAVEREIKAFARVIADALAKAGWI